MDQRLDLNLILKALSRLDELLQRDGLRDIQLLVGGGGALIGLYKYPGVTSDVDAISLNGDMEQMKVQIEEVARELKIPPDWINPFYGTFTISLPKDYRKREKVMYAGKSLKATALGPEDLLIMKFMAGRQKDHSHIKFLLKQKVNLKIVEDRLEELMQGPQKKTAAKALELFDEMKGDLE